MWPSEKNIDGKAVERGNVVACVDAGPDLAVRLE